jgi:hypothetical protein
MVIVISIWVKLSTGIASNEDVAMKKKERVDENDYRIGPVKRIRNSPSRTASS